MKASEPVLGISFMGTLVVTARDVESALLARCVAVARAVSPAALDQREANVFSLAAMVVRLGFPLESSRLSRASEQYFAAHPDERLPTADVVRNGWILGLPRLREMLSRRLS